MRNEDFLGTDRFGIRRLVGTGTFGLVFEAYDRQHDATVALKLLRAPQNLYRFKQEFRSLVGLAHPNLIALFELLGDGDRWFFTMQFVHGVNFLGHANGAESAPIMGPPSDPAHSLGARENGTLPAPYDRMATLTDDVTASLPTTIPTTTSSPHRLERAVMKGRGQRLAPCRDYAVLRDRLRQLGAGLSALHAAGKLHQDIKPSNVMVTHDQHVVLLDFGLVLDVDDRSMDRGPVGTPAYMAPEQTPGERVTPASDWYSVGVMMYQALTGHLPFAGETTGELLASKREKDPIPPSELVKGIPDDLERLCMDLLRRDASARPDRNEFMTRIAPGFSVARSSVMAAPLVGREEELEALWDAFRAVENRNVTALIQGESGMGKTALLQRFLRELAAKRPDALVLAGRCYAQESVPYKALDGVVDALAHFLAPHSAAIVEGMPSMDVAALARLFPVLQQIKPFAEVARTDVGVSNGHELRSRAFRALRSILRKLGARWRLVLVIDDLQWGDADSAELLLELFRSPQLPRALVILSYRDSEFADNLHMQSLIPDFRALGAVDVREMRLAHLSINQVRELATEILGGKRALRVMEVEPLAHERQSPLFALELIRHFSEELNGSPSDRLASLDDLIRERVRRAPPAAKHVLELLAIAARPTDAGIVHAATAFGDTGTETAIRVLMEMRLLRERWAQNERLLEPYHDRIGEVVARDIDQVSRLSHHRALAFALEARQVPDAEVLARHFYEGEILDEAAAYAQAAATQASNALAFDRAIRLYRFALSLVKEGVNRLPLRISLAEELARAGRGVESAAEFRAASEESVSIQSLELRRRAAEQLLRSGCIDDGVAMIRDNLQRYGIANPETVRKAVIAAFFYRAILRIRGMKLKKCQTDDWPIAALTRVDTYFSVALGYGMVDYARGAYFQVHHLMAALELGEPFRVARALLLDAAFGAAPGRRHARTESALAHARAVAATVPDPYLEACSALCQGVIASLEGRFRQSYAFCESAERGFRASSRGVAWELEGSTRYGLIGLCQLGEYARVVELAEAVITEAHQRGDAFAETNLRLTMGYWSSLVTADVDAARQHVIIARERWVNKGFQTQHYWAKLAEVDISMYVGDVENAHEVMTSGWTELIEWTMLKFHQYARVQIYSRRAKTAVACAAREPVASHKRRLLRAAERDADRLMNEREMDWARAQSCLTRGLVAEVEGDADRAIHWLLRAEATFATAEMMGHVFATRRRQGELLGGDAGHRLIAAANAWFVAQGVQELDRMLNVLVPRVRP